MNQPTTATPGSSRRTYTVTAHIVVTCEADLADPFTRIAVFRALTDRLNAATLVVDTPYGTASAEVGLVTAVS